MAEAVEVRTGCQIEGFGQHQVAVEDALRSLRHGGRRTFRTHAMPTAEDAVGGTEVAVTLVAVGDPLLVAETYLPATAGTDSARQATATATACRPVQRVGFLVCSEHGLERMIESSRPGAKGAVESSRPGANGAVRSTRSFLQQRVKRRGFGPP